MNNTLKFLVVGVISTFLVFSVDAKSQCDEAQNPIEVRVRNTPAGPKIFVDGKAVRPRFFFGSPQNMTILSWPSKSELVIPFVADVDTHLATFELKVSEKDPPVWFSNPKLVDLTEGVTNELTNAQEQCTRHFKCEKLKLKKSHRYHFHVAHRAKRARVVLDYEISYENNNVKHVLPLPYGDTLVDTVRMAGEHGFDLVTFSTENSWGCQSWWAPPEMPPAYGVIDEMCDKLIKANPRVLLVPRISANAPNWMLERDPSLKMKFNDKFTIEMSSVSSREYRKAACEAVEKLARHLRKKFPRNFAGLHISGQNSAEWFYMLSQTHDLSGYDVHTREAFREYLAKKGQKNAMAANVPTLAQRQTKRPDFRLDSKLDKLLIEFGRFRQEEMASFINELGAAVRRGTDGKLLALFFYGYTWEVGAVPAGAAETGHFFVDWLLKNGRENIDGISAPFSYAERNWPGSMAVMSAAETIMLNGILWINEDDTRTHHEELWNRPIKIGNFVNDSAWKTRNFLLRNSAKCILRGHGDWWMDLCGRGWFRDDELWRLREALKEMDEALMARKRPYSPEVALVVDEESLMMNGWQSDRIVSAFLNRIGIERCGAPYGQYLLDDVLENPPNAKLIIIAYARDLSAAKLTKLEKLKSRKGVRVVEVKKASDLLCDNVAKEAKKAGVHLYAPAGSAFVCAAEGYVVIQALKEGNLSLNFPSYPVRDVLTGKVFSKDAISNMVFHCGETKIFKIEEKTCSLSNYIQEYRTTGTVESYLNARNCAEALIRSENKTAISPDNLAALLELSRYVDSSTGARYKSLVAENLPRKEMVEAKKFKKVYLIQDVIDEEEKSISDVASKLPDKAGIVGAKKEEWQKLLSHPEATKIISEAEQLIKEPIPLLTDKLYQEYWVSGNRRNYERPYFARLIRLVKLTVAEALERKGRFVSPLVEIIDEICSMKTWVLPAHDRIQGNGGNFRESIITVDLFSSQTAAHLACTVNYLEDLLPQATICKIRQEVERRIFAPLRLSYSSGSKGGFYDPKKDPLANHWIICNHNWNAVCQDNVITAALILLQDVQQRAFFVAKSLQGLSYYSKGGFAPDGYCSEGMGYWNYGFGHFLMLGLTLRDLTNGKIDVFTNPIYRKAAEYAHAYQLEPYLSPAFADGNGSPVPTNLALVRRVWPDLTCPRAENVSPFGCANNGAAGIYTDRYVSLLGLANVTTNTTQSISRSLPLRSEFPQGQVWLLRAGSDLSVAIKGGHNAEHHNHNDIGSYYLVSNGKLLAGDPGGETYTARTFSARRYESKVLSSYAHPVPVVDGKLQSTGERFAAKVLETKFSDAYDKIVLDISKAYNIEHLVKLERTYVFDRTKKTFSVTDAFKFSKPSIFEEVYTTFEGEKYGNVKVSVVSSKGGSLVRKVERVENPRRNEPLRHSLVFERPLLEGEVTIEFSSLLSSIDQESQLKSRLPEIFARSAEHYKALDAEATKIRNLGNANKVVPHGWDSKKSTLDMRSIYWWTTGHYPGSLWYLYEATGEEFFKSRAISWCKVIAPNSKVTNNHDVGFIMYCSFGNERRLLKTNKYDELLRETAVSLSKRYNDSIGLIRSWGSINDKKSFLVIPDNMMNLELLEWASKNTGDERFAKIARSHATLTMKHHFRQDGGTYHVLNYCQKTGRILGIERGQGASCDTAWARGQAWAIYGYTMMYRETKDSKYLEFAQKVADFAIKHKNMPKDGIPYWDFGAPGEERDSSAAAIMASGLLELSTFAQKEKGKVYRAFAVKQLLELSSEKYFSTGDEIGHWLLKHGVGHKPGGLEIDTPLDYGDYYFLEALIRFKALVEN